MLRWLFRPLFRHLDRIEHALAVVIERLAAMALSLDSLIAEIDTETNTLAAIVDAQRAELAALHAAGSPPTQAQLDKLQAVSDRLKGLAADPANPVPAPEAPPAA